MAKKDNARPFRVSNSYEVPVDRKKNGWVWDDGKIKEFIKNHSEQTSLYGCYVFAIQAKKGKPLPVYVGCAVNRTLDKEAFCSAKAVKVLNALSEYKNATLTVTFVLPRQKGKKRCTGLIREVEAYLIAIAYQRNKKLQNIKGRGIREWYIKGVVDACQGKPTEGEIAFKSMMGL